MFILHLYCKTKILIKIFIISVAFFCWTQKKIFFKLGSPVSDPHWLPLYFSFNGSQWDQQMFGYPDSSKYLISFSTIRKNSYSLETTWSRINDDRIQIFCWTIPSSHKLWKCTLRLFKTSGNPLKSVCMSDRNIYIYNSFQTRIAEVNQNDLYLPSEHSSMTLQMSFVLG